MSRARAIAAATMLLASSEALAYVRETTVPQKPAEGKCLFWGTRTVPYKVNATSAAAPPLRPACPSCAPCLDASAATALIAATLPTWNNATQAGGAQACTDFTLQYGGTCDEHGAGQRPGEPDRVPDRLVLERERRPADRPVPGHARRLRRQVQLLGARRERHHRPHHHHLRPGDRSDARRRHRVPRLGRRRERVLPHLRDLAGLRQSAVRPGGLHVDGRRQRGAARGRARRRARPHLRVPGAVQHLPAQLGDAADHSCPGRPAVPSTPTTWPASAPSTRAARRR